VPLVTRPMELADTTVWGWRRHPTLRKWFVAALGNGEIAVCDMVALELLHSASTPAIYASLGSDLTGMPWIYMGVAEWRRSLEVYALLAARGNALHRSVKHADILIAAAAEVADIGLVHYHQDFDTIVNVTGQPARWVAPRGSL
jgi:predicted nucleic acid-binding protein